MADAVTRDAQDSRATFGDVFANREFRAVWLAHLVSITGDQFARVALTVVVYRRTDSPLLSALTYAASYLPWLIGGLLLAGLADRYPRRTVMILSDLVRMVLVAAMVAPGMPLWGKILLLFAVTTANAPFQGARSALYADILPGARYPLGVAVASITRQAGIVAGFVAGGMVVAVLGARMALLIDAATFGVSAVLLAAGVRPRPAVHVARRSPAAEMRAGVALVFGDPVLRTLMLFGWLGAFYTVAEPLAVPYAARLGGGAVAAGCVFAAGPLGRGLGSMAFSRWVPPAMRLRWIGPMAVATCLVLLACLAEPPLAPSLVVFVVSGAFAACQVAINAAFVAAAPSTRRGQAFSLANAGIQICQGVSYVLAGAAASVVAPAVVIAVSGLLGGGAAAWLGVTWYRLTRRGATGTGQ